LATALSTDWDALSNTNDAGEQFGTGSYIAFAVLTLALAFISIFFRASVVSGAHERLTGGDPTVRSALAGAVERAPKLLSWAVVTTIVGTILRAIEERSGFIGRMVIGFIGMAWAVTTFLVIPVILIENSGAIDSTKRSAQLFRHTWGENLAGQFGFGLIGFLMAIPIFIVGAIGVAIGTLIGFLLIAVAVVGMIVLMATMAALGGVFQTALYHYAVGTELVGSVDTDMLRGAFAPKR